MSWFRMAYLTSLIMPGVIRLFFADRLLVHFARCLKRDAGEDQRYRSGRLKRVMERARVVALAPGLGHDAIAVPVHDAVVLVLVPVAHAQFGLLVP